MAKRAEPEVTRYERGLALLRADRNPPGQAQAQVLSALEARLGAGPDPGPEGDGLDAPLTDAGLGSTTPYALKAIAATLGLAAAGLLTLRVAAIGVAALGSAETATPDQTPMATTAVAEVDDPDPDPDPQPSPAHPSAATSSLEPAELESAQPRADEAGHAAEPATPVTGPPTRDPGPDTAAELALIQRARATGDPSATIAALEDHAARFPTGILADERELLWVLADCERGALDSARSRAQRFAQRRPSSPLVARMSSGCPALEN